MPSTFLRIVTTLQNETVTLVAAGRLAPFSNEVVLGEVGDDDWQGHDHGDCKHHERRRAEPCQKRFVGFDPVLEVWTRLSQETVARRGGSLARRRTSRMLETCVFCPEAVLDREQHSHREGRRDRREEGRHVRQVPEVLGGAADNA